MCFFSFNLPNKTCECYINCMKIIWLNSNVVTFHVYQKKVMSLRNKKNFNDLFCSKIKILQVLLGNFFFFLCNIPLLLYVISYKILHSLYHLPLAKLFIILMWNKRLMKIIKLLYQFYYQSKSVHHKLLMIDKHLQWSQFSSKLLAKME